MVNFRPVWNKTQHRWCRVNMRSFLFHSSLSLSSLTASSSSAVTLLSLTPSLYHSLTPSLPPVLQRLLGRTGICRERSLHSLHTQHTHVPLKDWWKPNEAWPQVSDLSGLRVQEKRKRRSTMPGSVIFITFNEAQYYMQNPMTTSIPSFQPLSPSPSSSFCFWLTPQTGH